MPVPDSLSAETDSLKDEDAMREPLTEAIEDQVIENLPQDAIAQVCEAYFDLREDDKNLESWYSIRDIQCAVPGSFEGMK